MEKQYYTVREIILGLREEYIKNQKELEELKKCIVIRNEEVKSFTFEIGNEKEQEIIVRLQKRGNLLQRFIQCIMDEYVIEETECIYNNEKYFRSKNLKVDRNKIVDFQNGRKQVFANPFVEKIKLSPISLTGKGFDVGFWVDQKGIKLYKNKMMTLESMLEYSANTDTLSLKSGSMCASSSNLSSILNIQVPCMVFKNYHKEAIDRNSGKELYTEVFAPCQKASFTFNETQSGIVLVKTN